MAFLAWQMYDTDFFIETMTRSNHRQKFASSSTTRRRAKFAYNIFQDGHELAEVLNQ